MCNNQTTIANKLMSSDHEFGGVSTDLKLSIVEQYLKSYTTALRGKYPELWYIDAFAGTGERTKWSAAQEGNLFDAAAPEKVERFRGSARIAIDVRPAFDRLVFIERKQKHVEALMRLRHEHRDRQIDVLQGEANEEIMRLIRATDWRRRRAVMFLDPYGMSVAWTTLEAICGTKAIDIWYLVSLSGLFRQAARDQASIDQSKRDAINRMLGTADWEREWYRPRETGLFGHIDENVRRNADVDTMEAFVSKRLEGLFPKICKPLRLATDRNIPSFALFFAISNPDPNAIGLAMRIANHILVSGK